MEAFANWISNEWLAWFLNAYDWSWPVFEMLHFIGMAMLIGTVGLLDLRILGLIKGLPVVHLTTLVRIGVAGFIVNAVTGYIFVAGNPVGGALDYIDNLAFQLKMLLVLLAGINVVAFYFTGIGRAAHEAGPDTDLPRAAKILAGTSLVLWFGIIYFGRMIMYNDTLLYAMGR
jgi:hypothetical protein